MANDPEFRWNYQEAGTLWSCSRPFVLQGQLTNAINMVYIIQVWDDDNNVWIDLTRKLRQGISLGSTYMIIIDPSQILTDSLVSSYPYHAQDGQLGAQKLTHNLRKWRIIATPEYYAGKDGLLYHDEDISTWEQTEAHYVVDAAISHKQAAANRENNYLTRQWVGGFLGTASPEYRWATNRPESGDGGIHRCDTDPFSGATHLGYNDFISFFNSHNSGAYAKCRITTSSGMTNTFTISTVQNAYGHIQVGAGTRQLKNYLGAGNWDTATNNHTEAITRIDYWLEISSTKVTNELTTWVSNKNCCIETTASVELVWKNRMGGNDTFVLKGATGIIEEHDYDLFQRVQGFRRHNTEDPTHSHFNPYQYKNQWNQGSTNVAKINIRAIRKMKVVSQFMNKKTISWAAEIATAPRVWIREKYDDVQKNSLADYGRDEYLQQVYIKSTDITLKDKKTGLGQLELDIVYANPITTQRV